jgi:hypothetical protein
MVKWWETQVSDGCGILPSLPHVQCVTNPAYLDPVYMPKDMKDDVREMLLNLETYLEENGLKSKYISAIENIRVNVLDKEVDEEARKDQWNQLRNFIEPLDKYRSRIR